MIYFEALLCGNTLLKQRSIQYAMTDDESLKPLDYVILGRFPME